MTFLRAAHWHPLTHAYVLLLGALLFLWPSTTGIPLPLVRIVWIGSALLMLLVSAAALERSLTGAEPSRQNLKDVPWKWLLPVCCIVAVSLIIIPLHTFSDETNIALPALTLLSHLAAVITRPGILLLTIGLLTMALWYLRRPRPRITLLLLACMLSVVLAVSFLYEGHSTLFTRYPPLVHLLQTIASALTGGSIAFVRLPNLFWTLLLGLSIWHYAPASWSNTARMAGFAALLLGPMGWIYRISLYQACGEITLGITAVLLTASILRTHERTRDAALLGILFALWILYRPTSFVALCSTLFILWIMGKRQAALSAGSIALPIALLWIAMYPTCGYSFLFHKGSLFPAASRSLIDPILSTLSTLPLNFHLLTLTILIAGSIIIVLRGQRDSRILLGIAWILGLAPSLVQQMIQEPKYYGYPRFNILLLLPLCIVIAELTSQRTFPKLRGLPGMLCLALLLFITPFDAIRFAQSLRIDNPRIFQSTTGGDVPLPVTMIAEGIVRKTPHAVFVVPDVSFLEILITQGVITVEERRAIIARSTAWTPISPDRPVVIQAPTVTSYQPNMTAAAETRLKEARAWALLQPRHTIVPLGLEEAIIVP